jgi:hypothetical protein
VIAKRAGDRVCTRASDGLIELVLATSGGILTNRPWDCVAGRSICADQTMHQTSRNLELERVNVSHREQLLWM